MTKRRLYKMTPLQRDILAKVLVETQKEFPPEQAGENAGPSGTDQAGPQMQAVTWTTRKLDYAVRAVNSVRSGFLGGGQGHRRIRPCPLRAAQQQVQAGACAISLAVIPFPPDPVGVFFHGIPGNFLFL